MLVRGGLITDSKSSMQLRLLDLMCVITEKADSHKYVDTKGNRTSLAKFDKVGYSAFLSSQKLERVFFLNSAFKTGSEDRSASSSWALSVHL